MATLRSTKPYTPTPEAVDFASRALQSFADVVKNPPETITFGVIDPPLKDTQITIPSGIFCLIVDVLNAVSRGEAVTLLPHEVELTTQEAANLLNVSRPYLVKLLDEGIIPSRKVGVYRRVRAQDVMQYKQTERQRQEGILDELAKEAQDLDLGY
jgi:excisionase family DNA binding protein